MSTDNGNNFRSKYLPSYSSGIYGSYTVTEGGQTAAAWDWNDEKQSIISFDANLIDQVSVDDDHKHQSIRTKQDLLFPLFIRTSSNYAALQHESGGESCDIFPVPSSADKDTKIISFVLDLDVDDFCKNKIELFIDELSQHLNINRDSMDCLCVSKGSSIVWVKFNDLKSDKLQTMLESFINPTNKLQTFVDKFKLDIQRTIDAQNNNFKQVIDNLKMKISSETNTFSSINKWLLSHLNRLYPAIQESLKHCHYEFQIVDCMLVDVQQRIDEFVKYTGFESAKLLFHGTETTSYASIINNGFWINNKSLGKWYGIGAYFTNYPVYAMEYYCMKIGKRISDKNINITLIGSLVNTGNVREIYEKHIDEAIPTEYDCNHVRVFGTGKNKFGPVSKSEWNNKQNITDQIYDEYAVKESGRILPRYLVKLRKVERRVVVIKWTDANIANDSVTELCKYLKKDHVTYICEDSQNFYSLIKCKKDYCDLLVISDSEDGRYIYQQLGIARSRLLIMYWGHGVNNNDEYKRWYKKIFAVENVKKLINGIYGNNWGGLGWARKVENWVRGDVVLRESEYKAKDAYTRFEKTNSNLEYELCQIQSIMKNWNVGHNSHDGVVVYKSEKHIIFQREKKEEPCKVQ